MEGKKWRGYYLTAYGIAVKHGFKGTEEEWLESLIGDKGAAAQIRYNAETKILEWKTEEEDTWQVLLTLSDFQGEAIGDTLLSAEKSAESAASSASAAKESAEKAQGAVGDVEKKISEYGTTVKNAYVEGGILYIETSDGKKYAAGKVSGEDGHTPRRGEDYWTEEDKQEILQEVGTLTVVPHSHDAGDIEGADDTPTEGSRNLITSGGVADAFSKNKTTVIEEGGTLPPTAGAVYAAVEETRQNSIDKIEFSPPVEFLPPIELKKGNIISFAGNVQTTVEKIGNEVIIYSGIEGTDVVQPGVYTPPASDAVYKAIDALDGKISQDVDVLERYIKENTGEWIYDSYEGKGDGVVPITRPVKLVFISDGSDSMCMLVPKIRAGFAVNTQCILLEVWEEEEGLGVYDVYSEGMSNEASREGTTYYYYALCEEEAAE